jgi:hypothetical protein
MSEMPRMGNGLTDAPNMGVDDLFEDLARQEAMDMISRAGNLPTDVMLSEGAGALVDAAAYLRVVARDHGVPGSDANHHMLALADELLHSAAVWQQAADSASISIRAATGRDRTGA